MLAFQELRWGNHRANLAEIVPLAAPMSMFIEPTNVCNMRCVQCPESEPDYSTAAGYYGRMSMELYRKVVGDIQEFGRSLKSLKLWHLGEPLLHPNIAEMIQIANDAGITDRIELTTNASMLTADKARAIVKAGLHYMQVSIYSVDPERHEAITGTGIEVSKVLENVRQLRQIRDEAGSKLHIYAKLIWDSEDGNDRFIDTYAPIADEVGITQRNDWSGYQQRDFVTVESLAPEKAHAEAHRFVKRACTYPFYVMAVKANGDVVSCCVDWAGGTKTGNVKDASLSEIWNGMETQRLQRMHLEGRREENSACAGCTALNATPDSIDALSSAEFDSRLGVAVEA